MLTLFFNAMSKSNIRTFFFSYGPKTKEGDNTKHAHVNLYFTVLYFFSFEIILATKLTQFSLNLIFSPKGALLLIPI